MLGTPGVSNHFLLFPFGTPKLQIVSVTSTKGKSKNGWKENVRQIPSSHSLHASIWHLSLGETPSKAPTIPRAGSLSLLPSFDLTLSLSLSLFLFYRVHALVADGLEFRSS